MNFKGKYILGLSATPNRKDDLQPILYQQLGEISYEYKMQSFSENSILLHRKSYSANVAKFNQVFELNSL